MLILVLDVISYDEWIGKRYGSGKCKSIFIHNIQYSIEKGVIIFW